MRRSPSGEASSAAASSGGDVTVNAAKVDNGVDAFEPEPPKKPTFSTKRSGFAASTVFFGAEFAVRVNHVDPLNEGRRDVKVAWVADGEHGKVDLEAVLLRRTIGKRSRIELQGPALSAQADAGSLPLKVRFIGVGLSSDISGEMAHDTTPPRVELKVEVKLTDKSVASLAALAGSAAELTDLTAQLAGSEAGKTIGAVLVGAIPVISAGIAVISARRAVAACKDPQATITTKALAVGRALADATCVVFPVIGTLANIGLVLAAVGLAVSEKKKATGSQTTAADAVVAMGLPTLATST
jgi:hypothetical protein